MRILETPSERLRAHVGSADHLDRVVVDVAGDAVDVLRAYLARFENLETFGRIRAKLDQERDRRPSG